MSKTSRQLSDESFDALCIQFTRHSVELAIGDKQAFYTHVWSVGEFNAFWDMLEQPAHDWQTDC